MFFLSKLDFLRRFELAVIRLSESIVINKNLKVTDKQIWQIWLIWLIWLICFIVLIILNFLILIKYSFNLNNLKKKTTL
jgi:hypothetical protein